MGNCPQYARPGLRFGELKRRDCGQFAILRKDERGEQMDEVNNALASINKAKVELAAASDLYRVLEIRDAAKAAAAYADAKGAAEAANIAKEVQLRAERKAGEFLKAMPKAEGGQPYQERNSTANKMLVVETPTYKDLGIGQMQASRWQLTAELPEPEFERIISEAKDNGRELTSKEIINTAKEFRHKEARRQAAEETGEIGPLAASVVTGDFRQIMRGMPDNSIDMIFTDPPYDEGSIPLYGDMAEQAARILKTGGSLIAYCGHYAIPQITQLMGAHLRYWWMLALEHSGGSARLPGKWVYVGWKPLLWYVKGGRNNNNNFVADIYKSKEPTKELHDWQQDTSEAAYYIEQLTVPGSVVLDPFAGSGTTLIAALSINRQAIGIELDGDRANVCRKRIADYTGV